MEPTAGGGAQTGMPRETISGAHLYAILDQEFRKLRPKRCAGCRMPLPYYRRPPDDVSANWNIGTPSECSEGCQRIIAELVTRMWSTYDIEPERPQ